VNVRLTMQTKKSKIKNPIGKLIFENKYYWNRNMPVILRHEAFNYLQEVKRFLPEGEISAFEFEIAMNLFDQGREPKVIVRQLISAGCCRR